MFALQAINFDFFFLLLHPCTPHTHAHPPTHTGWQSWKSSSSSEDLSVLSVVGGEGVSSKTDVFFISQHYSLVFVLDMTPTMIQVVNTHTHVYMYVISIYMYTQQ